MVRIGGERRGWSIVEACVHRGIDPPLGPLLRDVFRLRVAIDEMAPCGIAGGIESGAVEDGSLESTHLIKRHPILDEKSYPRIQITHVTFEDEILLGLSGDTPFEVSQALLSYERMNVSVWRCQAVL